MRTTDMFRMVSEYCCTRSTLSTSTLSTPTTRSQGGGTRNALAADVADACSGSQARQHRCLSPAATRHCRHLARVQHRSARRQYAYTLAQPVCSTYWCQCRVPGGATRRIALRTSCPCRHPPARPSPSRPSYWTRLTQGASNTTPLSCTHMRASECPCTHSTGACTINPTF